MQGQACTAARKEEEGKPAFEPESSAETESSEAFEILEVLGVLGVLLASVFEEEVAFVAEIGLTLFVRLAVFPFSSACLAISIV